MSERPSNLKIKSKANVKDSLFPKLLHKEILAEIPDTQLILENTLSKYKPGNSEALTMMPRWCQLTRKYF